MSNIIDNILDTEITIKTVYGGVEVGLVRLANSLFHAKTFKQKILTHQTVYNNIIFKKRELESKLESLKNERKKNPEYDKTLIQLRLLKEITYDLTR